MASEREAPDHTWKKTDELKTLKDLKCIKDDEYSCCGGDKSKHERGGCGDGDSGPWTKDSDLKQAAIKVVKYYLELLKNKKPTGIDHKDQFINGSRNGAIAVMEEFFNITEEDLK